MENQAEQRPGWKPFAILAVTLGVAGAWIYHAPAHDQAVFPMPVGKTYVSECGSCHTAYAPGLLPARSWQHMLEKLEDHFGEDAGVAEPTRLALLKALEDHAADGAMADARMARMAAGIGADAAPLRFTETAYFRVLHDEIPAAVWQRKSIASRANCGACHPEANAGRYGEQEIRIPR